MLNTAAQPSPFDPLADMAPDEPRFVIRGKDPAGPGTITEWARLTRNWAIKLWGESRNEQDRRRLEAKLQQCAAAEEQAMEWSDLQSGGEQVEAVNATYQDVERTEEQIAALKRTKRIGALIRHLREAAYHACEARDGFATLEALDEGDRQALGDALDVINRVAGAAESQSA